jgi:hypothetical protein
MASQSQGICKIKPGAFTRSKARFTDRVRR